MFNKQKADLELNILSGSGSANRKILEKARWEGVWLREAEVKGFLHIKNVSNT